ncbi:MAG: hypothetical protein RQ982_10430 [Gammaproteobacteria bacterium]|nr:hypothetical protein [Gammaproteobacteria bacterium]
MGTENNNKYADNKYNGPEQRVVERRLTVDRRELARFSDVLGRRSGVDRRLPVR